MPERSPSVVCNEVRKSGVPMRRSLAIVVAFCLAFAGLFFAAPALAVDGEAKDVIATRVMAKATHILIGIAASWAAGVLLEGFCFFPWHAL